jgi:dephospho-CoA kinase
VKQREHRPYVIGITGTIGSGKSRVGNILNRLGIPVIDSDIVVHDLFSDDQSLKNAIRSHFGDNVIQQSNGLETIDRDALGRIVFADAEARKALEHIVHPAAISECQRRISAVDDSDLVAVLVPLLFEAGLEKQYDEIWAIYTNEETLRKRLSARDKLSADEIDQRLSAQLPQKEKIERSTEMIDNSGKPEETERQVIALVDKVRQNLEKSNEVS